MLQFNTFRFLTGLHENNAKPWFEANRAGYQTARRDVSHFAEELLVGLAAFDRPVAEAGLQALNRLSRLFRDVRFSSDKSPYKTNFFVMFRPGGKKSNQAAYYLHLEPGRSFAGGGVYLPETDDLTRIRQDIDFNRNEWRNLMEEGSFAQHFPNGVQAPKVLNRPPKGYAADHPALPYLEMKGFFTQRFFADSDLTFPDAADQVLQTFRVTQLLVHFLNRALVN